KRHQEGHRGVLPLKLLPICLPTAQRSNRVGLDCRWALSWRVNLRGIITIVVRNPLLPAALHRFYSWLPQMDC
ncbi:Hypothetical protein, putative, partial [Bodo saltans]